MGINVFPAPSASSPVNYNVGSTSDRVATLGYVMWNTYYNYPEIYDGTYWRKVSDGSFSWAVNGGTQTVSGGYLYTAFTSSTTFNVSMTLTCDVLVIGGGSQGAVTGTGPGGGSGGSVSYKAGLSFTAGSYSVVVGAGGLNTTDGNNGGVSGGTSSINSISTNGGTGNPGSRNGGNTPAGGTAGSATGSSAFSGASGSGSRGGGGAGAGGNGVAGSDNSGGGGGSGINTYATFLTATGTAGTGGGFVGSGGGGGDSTYGGGGLGANSSGGNGGYYGGKGAAPGAGGGGQYSSVQAADVNTHNRGANGLVIVRYAL